MFNSISETRANALYPYFLSALAYADISTCRRAAAFMAQVAHESGGLQYFEELASGAAYEGRSNLGNTQPGDGKRYKGRGPIQLTGRANYTAAAKDLGLDVVNNPESVCFPSVGFKTTAWFWKRNKLNTYCDSEDFKELTRRINGGYNGLADRQERWAKAKAVLGCKSDGSPRVNLGSSSSSSSSSSSTTGPSCSVPSRGSGVCMATSQCGGTSYPGYCPGAANIQCCVETQRTEAPAPWSSWWSNLWA
jgi:predicted chitinase